MDKTATLSTKEKAVHINIDSDYYGAIAEIGGGQETVRHLFQAGGASNTVAKSISAYDMLFSDHFYNRGNPSRHVAEERLRKMIDYEYGELIEILDKKNTRKFFTFANTVETLNFAKTNHGNGWLGIAVEGTDCYHPNKLFIHVKLHENDTLCIVAAGCRIHVKLHENDTLLQQYTLGALGINLIYGGLFQWKDPREVLLSLLDNLDTGRVEVDYVYVEGPDLEWVDNRLLNLMLVSNDMTPAIMFDPTGKVQQPGELLYKKNVIVLRGYFRPINNLGMEFMEDSLANFKRDEDYRLDNTIAFCEISLKYLIRNEKVDDKDFLHRVDLLNMMGQSVMVSKFYRYFQLVKYFAQFRLIKLRLVVGLPTFDKILDPSNYTDLRGGLLEAMGALFQENVKIYLYPYLDLTTGKVIYPEDSYFSETNRMLWQYLNATKKILVLKSIHPKSLEIHSEYISALIEKGDESLINYVPEKVCQSIKRKKLFGYKRNTSQEVLDV